MQLFSHNSFVVSGIYLSVRLTLAKPLSGQDLRFTLHHYRGDYARLVRPFQSFLLLLRLHYRYFRKIVIEQRLVLYVLYKAYKASTA